MADDIYFNEIAAKTTGLSSVNKLENFITNIEGASQISYQQNLINIINKNKHQSIVYYQYLGLRIKEYFLSTVSTNNNKKVIVSFLIDLTDEVKQTKELIKTATIDNYYQVFNLYKLNLDMAKYLSNKTTFLLIKLVDNIRVIYGTNIFEQYFKELIDCAKEHFSEAKIYSYSFYEVLVVLPYNDMRNIDRIYLRFLEKLKQVKSIILPNEKYLIKTGGIRYPVSTSETSVSRLFSYLDISTNLAGINDEINYFKFEYYENEIFEQHVINHINTAIDNSELQIEFNQIVDTKKNVIYNYESILSVPSLIILDKQLRSIAKRRGILENLDFKHFHLVLAFLSIVEKETNQFIRILIPASIETITKESFLSDFTKLLQDYQVPKEFIKLKLIGEVNKKSEKIIDQLLEDGIAIDSDDLNIFLKMPLTAYHYSFDFQNLKAISYLKNLKNVLGEFNIDLVVRNVQKQSEIIFLNEADLNLISGPFYQQISSKKLFLRIKEMFNHELTETEELH